MIAVPLAFSLRYVYILFLTIPLNLIVPFLKVKNENNSINTIDIKNNKN